MMKVFRALGPALLIGLFFAVPAQAQKIGVVNFQLLLQQSPQAEEATEVLESEFAPRQRELLALEQRVQEKSDRLNRDRSVLGQTELAQLEREIRDDTRELQRQSTTFQEDLNIRQNEELARVQRLLIEEVRTYAQSEGYDLVLGDAIYRDSDLDITEAVLEALREE